MFKDSNIYIKKNGLWKPVLEQGFWYLHFPGTEGSYVEARDIKDFEIGDQDAEIEVGIRVDSGYTETTGITETKTLGDKTKGWIIGGHENGTFYYVQTADGYEGSGHMSASWSDFWDDDWHDLALNYIVSDGKVEYFIDQVLRQERSNPLLENVYIENSFPLRFGLDSGNRRFHGDIRSFRFNDEYFDFTEGGGDTITSNKGTVMDILGGVEWRYEGPIKNVKIFTGMGWKEIGSDNIKIKSTNP